MSTYTPIASVTLSSAQDSVTFSGIPQTYTDLVLVVSTLTNNTSADDIYLRFNSDTGTNYSQTGLRGNGSAASSSRTTGQAQIFTTLTASAGSTTDPRTTIIQIMNYSNSTTNKTCLIRENIAGSQVAANVGLWRNTAAITTVLVSTGTGFDFASGSTFNLYGVANASITNVAKATGGDSVYTDGTYWYHIFRSSGTFTPTQALTADYLVVAGGGGGGYVGADEGGAGGGGAGGLRCTVTATGGGGSLPSAVSLTNGTAYTVTVGAGGAGSSANTSKGTQGSTSSITGTGLTSITTTGGGGGGSWNSASGDNGGSGGGETGARSGAGGTGTTNEGYAGATTTGNGGGGGGGAGAVGSNSGTNAGGNGGAGVATSITGSSVTYAGGGAGGGYVSPNAGGTGGSGGGGNGGSGSGQAGTAGTANLGAGGGGGGSSGGVAGAGGAGGSGIVIVRYAA